jgi:superfamily II DNA/RNA helicase
MNNEDPLDIKGKYNNFLNNKPYSAEYKELALSWSALPLYKNKDQMKKLFNSIDNNQVTLIISGTGSGKTVLVPKFLLKYFIINNTNILKNNENTNNNFIRYHNSNIVVTNPKILTTLYNAEYSAKTLDVKLGTYVGYKFRGSPDNMISTDTKLVYSTDGLLLAQILKDDYLLSDIQGVIIDEVHERQVPIDLLLYFIKYILKKRPEFKLIIMSATIDSNIFKKFYEMDNITFGHIEISGQSNYPITSFYMKPSDKINFFNYIDVGITIILQILEEKNSKGDILMFVTSQRETEIGCKKIKMLCNNSIKIADKCDTYYCAEVYGKMKEDKRDLAVNKDKYKQGTKYKRKIIFATNVAESSITLDGIVYVIESGLELLSYFDYKKYCQVIDKRYTTRAQVKQRMGRAGRTQPGICYHLYTEDKFNKLDNYPNPSIKLNNLNENFILFFKYKIYLSEVIILCKNLITPISTLQLLSAIRYLHFYNLIKIVSIEQSGGFNHNGGNIMPIRGGTPIKYYKLLKNKKEKKNKKIKLKRISSKNSDDSDEIEDKLVETIKLNYKMIPYKNLERYEYWSKYEGCLTRFGIIIFELSGYPIECSMMAVYSRLLNIPMLYSIIGVMLAMDNRLDNLIIFPKDVNQPQDKIKFINQNFPNACVYNFSDHLFIYNLLIQYYELDINKHLFVTSTFEKANEIKAIFSKTIEKISDSIIDEINNKYKLIPEQIDINDLDLIELIYLAIYLSYRYNTIRLIDIRNKPTYQTQYFLENTTCALNFSYGEILNADNANKYSWGICSNLLYFMNKINFNLCTLLPESLTKKFINYIL